MEIVSFKTLNTYTTYTEKDETEREIGYSHLKNASITGRNSFYPNVLLTTTCLEEKLVSPYDEKIMSLNKEGFYDGNIYIPEIRKQQKQEKEKKGNYFFFIYNFDNYYHFLYDTLPYLYTYLYLKQTTAPNLKLLVNYPNPSKKNFYKFNLEFLEQWKHDIVLHEEGCIYENVFISSSLTHGGYSNNPPRKEVYDFFRKSFIYLQPQSQPSKKRIYISRRTWINNDRSNIGTDYTTRRKMMNEDELVQCLTSKYGFEEFFAENLTTEEKITLFSQAEIICGSIGGGMSNLLFSPPTTKSIVLVTPFFLDINSRFRYSMVHTNIHYFTDVETFFSRKEQSQNQIPMYCRAKITNKESVFNNMIGEICDSVVPEGDAKNKNQSQKYLLNLSNNDVAGFSQTAAFIQEWFYPEEFELLDRGLNSPYVVDIKKLEVLISFLDKKI